jgi:hypothetical protein
MKKFYPQMSYAQQNYIQYILENPGCSKAEVARGWLPTPHADPRWAYRSIAGLQRQGYVQDLGKTNRTELYLTMAAMEKLAGGGA